MTRIAEKLIAALICTLLPTGAWAEARIAECEGWPLNVRNIVEPFDQSTRTFANGNIRILHIDTGGEPVCCSSHLVILAPNPAEEEQFRICKLLTDGDVGNGFLDVNIKGIKSSYSPSKGLLLSVPVLRYNFEDGVNNHKATIDVRINQATGAITIE